MLECSLIVIPLMLINARSLPEFHSISGFSHVSWGDVRNREDGMPRGATAFARVFEVAIRAEAGRARIPDGTGRVEDILAQYFNGQPARDRPVQFGRCAEMKSRD